MNNSQHILHWSPRSPFVKKIDVAAHELGLSDQFTRVRSVVPTDDLSHAIFDDNPLGKIPAIVTTSDGKFYDSPVIMEYLDYLHEMENPSSELRLFPQDPLSRIKIKQIEALCDGSMDLLVAWLFEWYVPTSRAKTNFRNSRFKVDGALDHLELHIEWIDSFKISAASISTACLLAYLDFRFTRIIDWRDDRPKLSEWYIEFAKRPSVKANPFKEG